MSDTQIHRVRIKSDEDELVPRILVRAVMALLLVILSMAAIAVITDRPLEGTPAEAPILQERVIYLSGVASGAARVLDANGALLADFPADKGGFVAGVERVITCERAKVGADPSAPVLLRLKQGNRLSLHDPETN